MERISSGGYGWVCVLIWLQWLKRNSHTPVWINCGMSRRHSEAEQDAGAVASQSVAEQLAKRTRWVWWCVLLCEDICLKEHTHPFNGPFPGLPGWAGTRKVKPIWILMKQETVSGSGISWAICKSAPRSRQITMPAPRHSVFTGRMPFLPPNQQRQSTEGTVCLKEKYQKSVMTILLKRTHNNHHFMTIIQVTLL